MATSPPHAECFTRLRASPIHGVGVFAIRNIPERFPLFQGDHLQICRVPEADVEQIEDPAIRQLYKDYCPLINGQFIAPNNFNGLTQAWYVNHSESPNVRMDSCLEFSTICFIEAGQELTFDYRTLVSTLENHWP